MNPPVKGKTHNPVQNQDTTFYFIHHKWIQNWKQYVTEAKVSPPGPIDNSPLLIEKNDGSNSSGLVLQYDPNVDTSLFYIVSKKDWKGLKERFVED